MDCHNCKEWSEKEKCCNQYHTNMTDPTCLMKVMIWLLADIASALDEPEEGEDWKI